MHVGVWQALVANTTFAHTADQCGDTCQVLEYALEEYLCICRAVSASAMQLRLRQGSPGSRAVSTYSASLADACEASPHKTSTGHYQRSCLSACHADAPLHALPFETGDKEIDAPGEPMALVLLYATCSSRVQMLWRLFSWGP